MTWVERARRCRKKSVFHKDQLILLLHSFSELVLVAGNIKLDSRRSAFIYAHANQLFISGEMAGKYKRVSLAKKMSENEECQAAHSSP